MTATDPLTPRQRQLVDSTRRARPALMAFVVSGAALAITSAAYSVAGLQTLSRDPLTTNSVRVPKHLAPLVGALGPRLPWVVPPDTCEERERLLLEGTDESGRLRVHIVLIMWYGLAGV